MYVVAVFILTPKCHFRILFLLYKASSYHLHLVRVEMLSEKVLAGIKILDLTHYIAGPYCTRTLAGFGADVIKIERPGTGDGARRMGPFLDDKPGAERSGLFLYLNCGKRSITLNLKAKEGVKIFRDLVEGADAVVESFKPGVMARLGLDYAELEGLNQGLVMTSISNFGQNGPYKDYKSSHLITWGMSDGRYNDGEPGVRPIQGGGWLTHYFAGIHAAFGTAVALYSRNETGAGQHIDVSMWESALLSNSYPGTVYAYLRIPHSGFSKPRLGILPCKDGYIGLNYLTHPQWELLCTAFGMPELTGDPRFLDAVGILENLEDAKAFFTPHLMERKKMDLFLSGGEWRIPLGLVPTTEEILESPQHQARGFFDEIDHPIVGKVTMPGAPFKMAETPWQMTGPAPLLGEHNEEIYCNQLGYTREDLVRMRQQETI